MTGDLLIFGGPIVTLDPVRRRPQAVAVRDGRIGAVGRLDELRRDSRPRTRELDLAGRALVPGFYDAHQHQIYGGLARTDVDGRAPSVAELVARVAAAAKHVPAGTWLEGGGWDENAFADRRPPTRADLDGATAAHPAFVTRTCGHAMTANSRALALAGVTRDLADPPAGRIERDEHGEPTGVLHETAMELIRRVLPPRSPAALERAIVDEAAINLGLGITSLWEPSIEPDQLVAYRALRDAGRMPLRVTMAHKRVLRSGEVVPLPEPFRGPWLSLTGVKLFQDGGIAPRTAAMGRPYEGEEGNCGLLRWPQDELNAIVAEIHRAGLQASIHAIGDAAITSALDAIEAAIAADPGPHLHRIEHCGLPLDSLPDRIGASGVVPVVQTPFVHFHGDAYMRSLGDVRSRRLYPARTLLERCSVVAGSSDAPVVPDASPLLGIRAAITRRTASGTLLAQDEALTFPQGLYLYTLGAAAAAGEAHVKGSITPGKLADLVVLDGDLADPELAGVSVSTVVLDGQVVREG